MSEGALKIGKKHTLSNSLAVLKVKFFLFKFYVRSVNWLFCDTQKYIFILAR